MFPTDLPAPAFGPSGETVFRRTYSRPLPNGQPEQWADTVGRVVRGNLSLVYGKPETWTEEVKQEALDLFDAMYSFSIIPAGRHLWASGIPGRQYLFNCHVAGWNGKVSEHFAFTFMRLMEGGGVGANYSSRFTEVYGAPKRALRLHVVCDPEHEDFDTMLREDVLSTEYDAAWPGAFAIEDSREGWAAALSDLLETFYADDVAHADRVYDVSRVRPRGARLRTFGGTASGPAPLARMLATVADVLNACARVNAPMSPLDAMAIDQAIGECVVAGGVRRSARMSIVRWDDPYVLDFVNCKADTGQHWTTNISVEIDDAFLHDLSNGASWATIVHKAVCKGMLVNGEPGYWNSSLSNHGEIVNVEATNPCGEIALQPWENCNLGHVNLEAFAEDPHDKRVRKAHRLMTRFLVRATFGDVTDAKQAAVLASNRRIGVGHMGVQGFIVRNGERYSTAPQSETFRRFLRMLREDVRKEAREYAFKLRIPEPIKVTTVAPTGSIAKLPGVTEGIHPIYARYFMRRIRFSMLREDERAQVEEFRTLGYHVEPCIYAANTMVVAIPTKERLVADVEALGFDPAIVESADEIDINDMLAFQSMYQTEWADNAVSFTVNVPEGRFSPEYLMGVLRGWLPALKGTTIMPDGTRPQAPYERLTREEYEARTGESAFTEVIDDSFDEACASGACPIR